MEEGRAGEAQALIGTRSSRRLQALTCGLDRTIAQWDARTGEQLRRLLGHSAPVRGPVIVNGTLFSCSSDFTVRQWDTASGRVRSRAVGGQSAQPRRATPRVAWEAEGGRASG